MPRFENLPFIVLLIGMGAAAMFVPSLYAYLTDDLETARAFLYSGLLFSFIFVMIALATEHMRIRRQGRSHLISMFSCLTLLPIMLCFPMAEAVTDTRFFNVYFEMVSSLTTTGFTLFEPDRLPPAIHLWRGMVGWMGGYFIWVTALAILAPMNLGGFEVTSQAEIGQGARQIVNVANSSQRLQRYAVRFLPIYGGLTCALWLALFVAGDTPLVALVHAMSTISTSSISPIGGLENAASGQVGELVVFVFFVFALSRITFLADERPGGMRDLIRDPELRIGVLITVCLAMLLFLRHWLVSFEEEVSLEEGIRGLWGALFTVASFLTTTGFVSEQWEAARAWSGFGAPSVLLLGLAVLGGGVATTAGGVKLLRIYSLAQHGMREMEKLVQPSSIGSAGQQGRHFRRQGAYSAWVFFMLFAVSIALVMLALSLAGGQSFEDTLVLTIAALSTTGPLATVAAETPLDLPALNDAMRGILCAAMILGRLEALAIIALLNPEFWRS